MSATLAHRGPDDTGAWVEGPVGLACQLLRATPESAQERQPLVGSSRAVVVFDGRLDNREELIRTLTAARVPLGSYTDPELVLEAYQKWGEAAFTRLLGDFAVVVWDLQSRRLFCARDPLGVKPLYYHWNRNRFAFASEPIALLAPPGPPPEPDEAMIADLLVRRFRDPEATFFKGVRQLPAAHFLSLDADGLRVSRYWDLDPARETRYSRTEDYLEHCRDLFKEAVRCRLRSGTPVAVLLSGGIDSTSVTAMAETLRRTEHATPPIVAFTLLAGIESDEWEAVQALEEAYGTEVNRIRPEDKDGRPLTLFEILLNNGAQPHYDGFLTLPLTLKPASSRGCRTLLTGIGADEQMEVAEDVYIEDLLYTGRLNEFLKQFRLLAATYRADLWGAFLKFLLAQVRVGRGRRVPRWVASSFAGHVRDARRRGREQPRGFATRYQEQTYRNLTSPAFPLGLTCMDTTAAAYSLDVRHPFLDSRLVEFLLSIPPAVKFQWGFRKMFFQRAMAGIVPSPLRPAETGVVVSPQSEEWMRRDAERLEAGLFHPNARVFRYVDRCEAERLRDRYLAGAERYRNRLWEFARLESWLQRHGGGG
ncbi:MAG: asparagine synthetase B family protein [Acidimicrobiia bacterium]